jgi:hypothetical protein
LLPYMGLVSVGRITKGGHSLICYPTNISYLT